MKKFLEIWNINSNILLIQLLNVGLVILFFIIIGYLVYIIFTCGLNTIIEMRYVMRDVYNLKLKNWIKLFIYIAFLCKKNRKDIFIIYMIISVIKWNGLFIKSIYLYSLYLHFLDKL